MSSKRVLVTGIGGMVGQGILRNIRSLGRDIELIGTNVVKASPGNHLCDRVYELPMATEPGYFEGMAAVCRDEAIDLIIPSTDYETYQLALHRDELPFVACSDAEVAGIFLDKFRTWQALSKHGIRFAESMRPSSYDGSFGETIVKPAAGRGSRGIHVNPDVPTDFSDDHVVQKLYRGREITSAFYVDRHRRLTGHLTMERQLLDGYTQSCTVVVEHDRRVEHLIRQLMACMALRCSYNIQSIVTADGDVVPFEINARVSGTNSIRSQFGFEDVRYILDEYLDDRDIDEPSIRRGSAYRMVLDIIFPEAVDQADVRNDTEHHLYYL